MSRIGKIPVELPKGVKAALANDVVQLEGPLGKLECRPNRGIAIAVEGGKIVVSLVGKDKQSATNFGTTRSHLKNCVIGVSTGWKRNLELNGVGYNARVQGSKLVLAVGFSHEVQLEIPKGVKCTVNKNVIELESCDRELVGTFAAKIRKVQPPEPYLGKGIKFAEEVVRRKAGKTGKK
ncbi:MAG: 50S ribosomal protein L6 [Proteobacteria bacterium]|nr:MAG: 50S ribosomal protein L6 [Pseudomonadota bacterium]